MRVGVLRSVRVKAGELNRFEFLMTAFLNDVSLFEEGCVRFTMMQSPTDALAFTFHEEYAEDATWEAHQATDHKRRWWPSVMQVVETMTCSRFDLED